MAYTKQTWSDLAGTGLNKYSIADSGNKKALTWNPDSITNAGTPVNAERMNHIEDGLEETAETADTAKSYADDNAFLISVLRGQITQLQSDLSNKIEAEYRTVSLTTSWTASGSLFTQTVSVSGMTADYIPLCQAVCDTEAQADAWSEVIKVESSAGALTFYALESLPALTVKVLVIK